MGTQFAIRTVLTCTCQRKNVQCAHAPGSSSGPRRSFRSDCSQNKTILALRQQLSHDDRYDGTEGKHVLSTADPPKRAGGFCASHVDSESNPWREISIEDGSGVRRPDIGLVLPAPFTPAPFRRSWKLRLNSRHEVGTVVYALFTAAAADH